MGLVVAVLVAALAVGLLRGGGLHRAAALPLRAPGLVVAAVLTQAAGTLGAALTAAPAAAAVGLAGSALLALAFLARNRRLPGAALVALGLLGNAVVVAANGAMPVSAQAAARSGLDPAELALESDPRHEPQTPDTRLPALGDVVPVPLPVRPEVVSPGDLAVAAGLGQLVVAALVGVPAPGRPARPGTRRRGGTPGPAPRRR